MEQSPYISVVMPVYNGQKFIKEAVESILEQTFNDFELIIVNDGSIDKTGEIIKFFSERDNRVRVFTNAKNIGCYQSRNIGLATAQGKFIAVMDSDDISVANRFELQLKFMEENPSVGVVGGNAKIIDENGQYKFTTNMPKADKLIRWQLCFSNPFIHPSVLMRKEIVKQLNGYNTYMVAQDYDLIERMTDVTKLANLPEVLVLYRQHGDNLTALPYEVRAEVRDDIRQRAIQKNLTSNKNINWNKYWNDPFYSAKVIYALFESFKKDATKCETKYIRRDAGKKIYKKAMAVNRNKIKEKILIYFLAFYLNPRLIKERLGI